MGGWDYLQARIPIRLKVEFEKTCKKQNKSMTGALIEILRAWLETTGKE